MSNNVAQYTSERRGRRGGRSLRGLVLRSLLLLVIALSVVLTTTEAAIGFQETRQAAVERLEIVANLKQQQIERWVDDRGADLAVLASAPSLVSRLKVMRGQDEASQEYRIAHSDLSVQLTDVLRRKVAFTELFVMDADNGVALVSTDPSHEGERYRGTLYFEQGKLGMYYLLASASPLGPHLELPNLLITHPVSDPSSGQLVAVLAGRANLADLGDVIREMGGLEGTSETYLVNSKRQIVTTCSGQEMQGRAARSLGIDAALSGQNGWSTYRSYTGAKVVGAYRWLSRLGMALMVEQEESVAVRAAWQLVFRNAVVAILALFVAVGLGIVQSRIIVRPLAHLTEVATAIAGGNLSERIEIGRRDEIGALANAFAQMTAQLRDLIGSLEQRVAERTQALAYRSAQLETAAQVSEAASSMLDPVKLEQQVVELILQRFDYYYVGLFLADESGEWTGEPGRWAVLQAGTGEAGRAMLENEHKLEIGGASMIGSCIADSRARIALDVGQEVVRFVNPLLPETRSEMALPLIARGQVIGALTVQSEREGAFSKEDISILQAMVAQVANAIQNARLFESERVQLRLAQTLQEVGALLTTRMNLDEVFERIFDLLAQVVECDTVSVQLLAEDGSAYLGAARGFPDLEPARQVASTVAGQTLEERWGEERVVVVPDTYADDRWVVAPGLEYIRSWIGAALLIKGRSLGILNVDSATLNAYDAAMGETVGAFANQAAVAIENARLFEREQKRRQMADALVEVSRSLGATLDLSDLLDLTVEQLGKVIRYDSCAILLLEGEELVLTTGRGFPVLEEARQVRFKWWTDTVLSGRVVRERAPVVIPDTRQEPRWQPMGEYAQRIKSWIGAPLIAGGEVLGVLTVDSLTPGTYSVADAEAVAAFAHHAALAIANARLLEAEQRRRRAAIALQEAFMALSGLLEPEQVYQETLDQLARIAPYDSAAIFIYDEETRVARPVAARGVPTDVLEEMVYGTSFNLHVDNDPLFLGSIETGRPVILHDAQADDRFFKTEGTEYIRGWMGVPMLTGDRIIGLLTLDSRQVGAFDEDTALRTLTFAAQAGLALENARLFQETQANLQEITRLHRSYLQERWEEFLAEEGAQRHAGYLFDQRKVRPAGDLWRPEIEMAVARGRTLALTAEDEELIGDDGDAKSALVVPLQLRGQTIGVLDFFEPDRDRTWSEDDIALVEAVAAQVALAVENARAYEELRKTAVQLREMDTLKSQFLANMSHELRTPLNSIIGFSRVMLKGIDGPVTDLQRTDLTSIYNNGQHLLGLINDVLDISRIEAGKIELVFEPVDLRSIIDGVMSTAVGLVKDKPVQLIQKVSDDLPIVRADSTRIRQVLLNLMSNAAKFTEKGSITVRTWADNEHVTITVADTGIGVPEEYREKIFEEFQQVDGSATRSVGGSGLGLAICRRFVELHSGHIWMESEVGVGSAFTFTIPIFGPDYVKDPELAALEIDPDRRLVLAVEDSEEIVGFYRRYLERHGYQVISLAEGSRAPLWVRELSPFALLLDVVLPDVDGWAVLEKLKSSRETAHVPVIVCSILDEEARGLSLGAAAYLTKPVLEGDLLQALAVAARLQSI